MPIVDLENAVLALVNEYQGIKVMELLPKVIMKIKSKNRDGSDIFMNDIAREFWQTLNRLIREKKIIELEYLLPSSANPDRVRSFLLPGNAITRFGEGKDFEYDREIDPRQA